MPYEASILIDIFRSEECRGQHKTADELWELAKATNSTVEAIRKANGLTGQPSADQMLLIPIP